MSEDMENIGRLGGDWSIGECAIAFGAMAILVVALAFAVNRVTRRHRRLYLFRSKRKFWRPGS